MFDRSQTPAQIIDIRDFGRPGRFFLDLGEPVDQFVHAVVARGLASRLLKIRDLGNQIVHARVVGLFSSELGDFVEP